MSRSAEIAAKLVEIGADLDDLSFDVLRDAVADGATQRPAADKTIAQARRAVEKAARLLESLDE